MLNTHGSKSKDETVLRLDIKEALEVHKTLKPLFL